MTTRNGNAAVEDVVESVPTSGAGFLTREAILAADDTAFEIVELPEWGGRLRVKGLSGKERDRFEASITETRGKSKELNLRNVRAKLVALTAVDASGRRIFEDEDVARLGEKSAAALSRVYDVAARLCGLTEADAEELAKNSESDQGDDSLSA
jgi:hypothetical protein